MSTTVITPIIKPSTISRIFEKNDLPLSLINFETIRDFHNIIAQMIFNYKSSDDGAHLRNNQLLSTKTFNKILKALGEEGGKGLHQKVESLLIKFLKFVKSSNCFNLERCFREFSSGDSRAEGSLPSKFWYMIPSGALKKEKSPKEVSSVLITGGAGTCSSTEPSGKGTSSSTSKFHFKNPKIGETLEEYIARLENINGTVPIDKMDKVISIYSGHDNITDLKYKPKKNETFNEYLQRTALERDIGFFRYFSEKYITF